MSKIVDTAVAELFHPPNLNRVVRRTLIAGIAIVVLCAAAWELRDTRLVIPLAVFAGWRIITLGVALVLLTPTSAEKQRRLNALPPEWLHFLRTGSRA